ncbi:nucleotidyltransferase [Sinorhizobium meliloti]|uniref:nucleotidyltransferase domain-containing protein n=1 Tax=Rhizobium meliloti TaxID=382 RepID=UPI000FDB2C98|nr:nucleotidyltransferase [Sinorhizobium meliloti]RVH17243.1 nucleotidyltransferase [Sinorhizobium meliloti]
MPDQYLRRILVREAVDYSQRSPVRNVQSAVTPIIQRWAGSQLVGIFPSGSFAKHTANASGTDIDLFISLKQDTVQTLKEIYESLFKAMNGHSPKRQNVSINVKVNGYDVDLVPAKRQNGFNNDHSLYRRRADSWTKTDVSKHIIHVLASKRAEEIRVAKLWRSQKGLDFPSFYLEMTVIEALRGTTGTLSQNVVKVLEYLRDRFANARVIDPANTNNVVSDDLNATERTRIGSAAGRDLRDTWENLVK